jgi:hypothetical protein
VSRTWLSGAVVLVLGCAIAAVPAAADPIAGATYRGVAADGATVELTVSSDGALVDSYVITGVNGQVSGGGTCMFVAEGQSGVWEGAPIANNAFAYQLRNQISFQGTFQGVKAASGTFRLYTPPTTSSPGCDTGMVNWTATTTAAPRGGSGGGGGGGSGGGTGGNGHKPTFTTRVTFRRASSKMLRGQLKSPKAACRAGRTVILWRGKHRIASTKSKAGGKFSFAAKASMRGRPVRASTPARSVSAGACAAGSSKFIKG